MNKFLQTKFLDFFDLLSISLDVCVQMLTPLLEAHFKLLFFVIIQDAREIALEFTDIFKTFAFEISFQIADQEKLQEAGSGETLE